MIEIDIEHLFVFSPIVSLSLFCFCHNNPESARARRKRKKVLLDTLEQQVAELAKRNQKYQASNDSLTSQVRQLEADLAVARSTIALLSSQQPKLATAQASMGGLPLSAAHEMVSQDAVQRILQARNYSEPGGSLASARQTALVTAQEDALLRQSALSRQRDPILDRFGQNAFSGVPTGLHPSSFQNTVVSFTFLLSAWHFLQTLSPWCLPCAWYPV